MTDIKIRDIIHISERKFNNLSEVKKVKNIKRTTYGTLFVVALIAFLVASPKFQQIVQRKINSVTKAYNSIPSPSFVQAPCTYKYGSGAGILSERGDTICGLLVESGILRSDDRVMIKGSRSDTLVTITITISGKHRTPRTKAASDKDPTRALSKAFWKIVHSMEEFPY